ncbi:hypothetical protein VE03_08602 [Pseudogymnoascus sp. 23342-1-I1]|nr:hypothetical protein VE03_08602 [Pseudogymnoascus sp. 23342-1-I1]
MTEVFNPYAVFNELYKQICQGIRYHRSENVEENAFDTIARATSAALLYFKPYKGYHDGGLRGHNNLVNLAL